MIGDVVVAILLVLAVGTMMVAALGVLVVRGRYDRLHFTGVPMVAGLLVAVAVLIDDGEAIVAEKAALLALLLVVTSPVGVQVLARATRLREGGALDAGEESSG